MEFETYADVIDSYEISDDKDFAQWAPAENTDEVPAFLAELKLLRPGERMSTLAQQA